LSPFGRRRTLIIVVIEHLTALAASGSWLGGCAAAILWVFLVEWLGKGKKLHFVRNELPSDR